MQIPLSKRFPQSHRIMWNILKLLESKIKVPLKKKIQILMQPNHDPIISQIPQTLLKIVRPQPEEAARGTGLCCRPCGSSRLRTGRHLGPGTWSHKSATMLRAACSCLCISHALGLRKLLSKLPPLKTEWSFNADSLWLVHGYLMVTQSWERKEVYSNLH